MNRPSKIVCVGRNYLEHARELGNEVPERPLLFFKPPSAIVADGEAIVLPPESERVEHEGEIAVVILTTHINELALERGHESTIARAHHGSVSHEQRAITEEALKRGDLPCVVATSNTHPSFRSTLRSSPAAATTM